MPKAQKTLVSALVIGFIACHWSKNQNQAENSYEPATFCSSEDCAIRLYFLTFQVLAYSW
jgi:hypothetical protein